MDSSTESTPQEYARHLDDHEKLERIRQIDWIIATGREDPAFNENVAFSHILWEKSIWHAFRIWDGNAHNWPYWQEMILRSHRRTRNQRLDNS